MKRKKKATKPKHRDERGRFLPGNPIAAKWTEEKALKLGEELLEWMQESQSNFWINDFLLERGLYQDVTRYLSDKYARFSGYIARAKEIQASRIQKFGLMNQLNTGMVQWVLSVHHKMQNVQKTETEMKTSQPIILHVDSDDVKG